MQYKKGTNRVVLIFPRFGFVIKFPRFHVWVALKTLCDYVFHKRLRKLIPKWFKYDFPVYGGFKFLICKGVYDNWQEYRYYRKTKNIFLQPTYFSLFGFFNIQLYAEYKKIFTSYCDPLLKRFMGITNEEAYKDPHHFSNPENFCFANNSITVVDYGSSKTQEIISKWGQIIVAEFNVEQFLLKNALEE